MPDAALFVLDPGTGWRAGQGPLAATRASIAPLLGGTSIAAHAAHTAYVLEAIVRGNPKWRPERVRGGRTNLAHLACHLGAVRQLLHGAKALRTQIAGYCAV